jgi:hypothetical protein
LKIEIVDNILKIEFTTTEKILSVHGSMDIPISHIIEVSGKPLEPTWKEVRMPGTSLSGVIKAGTYFTSRGKEFRYATMNKEILRIELKDEFYDRLVLGVDDSSFWVNKLAVR